MTETPASSQPAPKPTQRNKIDGGLLVVLFTVMINMMGVGLVWPILPSLVGQLSGGTISQIAVTYGIIAVVFSIAQFLFAPLMGGLSDRFGRKPVMLLALTGLGLDNLLLALAPTVTWLIFARLVGGVLASTMSIANAFIADRTDPGQRAAGFGMVGAAFGVGFILGPLLGGVLGEVDIRLPFYVAAGLSFANVAFGLVFLKESLPPEKRSSASLFRANPFSALLWLAKKPSLLMLGIALLLATVIQRGLESIWVLFTQYQYGWGSAEAGISLAIVGVSFVFVQGFLVRRAVGWFGEHRIIIGGFCLSAMMYLMLSFNTWGLLGFIGIVPHVLGWGLAQPALQSIASQAVEEDQQGLLQGALTGIMGLSAILGPTLASASFAWFTSSMAPVKFPGAFFALGSIALLGAAWFGVRAAKAQ